MRRSAQIIEHKPCSRQDFKFLLMNFADTAGKTMAKAFYLLLLLRFINF
jgi:hypothetical protein